MRVDPLKLSRNIDDFVLRLQRMGIIYTYNPHQVIRAKKGKSRVSWRATGTTLTDSRFASLSEYIENISKSNYSFVLNDGGVFQVSYDIEGRSVVGHRLAWFPCPAKLTEREILEGGIEEAILQKIMDVDLESISLGPVIRFDYSPDQAGPNHSKCHLHMFHNDCRIPVKSPLSPLVFFRFVFKNFYPGIVPDAALSGVINWSDTDILSESERSDVHLYRRS